MNKKYKTPSLINLVAGYVLFATFILLVIVNRERLNVVVDEPIVEIVEVNNTIVEEKIVYVPAPGSDLPRVDYVDRLNGVIIDDPDNVYTSVVRGINNTDVENVYDRDWSGRDHHSVVTHGVDHVVDGVGGNVNYRNRGRGVDVVHDDTITYDQARREDISIDPGLLDRRLKERRDLFTDSEIRSDDHGLHIDDQEIDLGKLTVAKDDNEGELGDVDMDLNFDSTDAEFGVGKGGQLYAYNYPSQGVGAGIGTSGLGAGGGAGAGLSAGIGEGIASGSTVPTLGGVGTYTEADDSTGGGVGGLVGGAGAGGAAGLYTGTVDDMLGVGSGGPGGSGGGYGRDYDYSHLPKDGALHIMIHVDGSGSLLSTRVKLDEMKKTLLKSALLPYYNNDESLYNKRVTIIDDSKERTLRFFTQATKKDNVLAIAFQDEASPDYHLPNFNKVPQDAYSSDLGKLKNGLNGYKGVYRGVMFQVDRGRTFSKSFKEMVECAFNGEGYLEKENLKKYHRDNNQQLIRTKRGVVFSDEYHAKSEGDPQYYLDLIFKASKRVGLDLDIYGAGLKDGKNYSSD